MKQRVLLAYVHGGEVRAEFMASVLSYIIRPESPVDRVMDLRSGPGLTISRNTIGRAFLESGMDWLWMVDSDIQFSPNTLPALLSHAHPDKVPIIGANACVYTPTGDVAPTLYEFAKPDDASDELPKTRYMADWQPDTLTQVAATGCGCLLVHRTVFEKIDLKMPEDAGHWFAEMRIGDEQLGEDISFCVRAGLCGMPVHVHTGIKVGHIKAGLLGEVNP